MGVFAQLIGQPIEEILTGSIKLALPFMQAGVAQGFSANAILNLLTASGLGVNRAKGLAVIKALRTPFGAPTITKAVGNPYGLDPALFRAAPYPTAKNYTYVFKVTGTSPVTGLEGVQYINVTSDTLLTYDDAAALAETAVEINGSGQVLEDTESELEQIKLSPTFAAP